MCRVGAGNTTGCQKVPRTVEKQLRADLLKTILISLMVKRHAVNMKDFSSSLKLGVVSSSVD